MELREGMLTFFKRTEKHHDPHANPEQHGFSGSIRKSTGERIRFVKL
jgi:hypothetical protein